MQNKVALLCPPYMYSLSSQEITTSYVTRKLYKNVQNQKAECDFGKMMKIPRIGKNEQV